MKKTKQIILEKALQLFNDKGYTQVTLRQIAQSMDISQGNLNYHFKKKTDILEGLYFELVEKLNSQFEAMVQPSSLLQFLYDATKQNMTLLFEYRFLLRDFAFILQNNSTIQSHYLGLQHIRKEQMVMIMNNLCALGIMRKEEFQNEFNRLYERMQILGDNWINTYESLKSDLENPVNYYMDLLFELVYPYLTEAGKKEYKKIN